MRKFIFSIALFCICAIGAGYLFLYPYVDAPIKIHGTYIFVERVSLPPEVEKGLGQRDALCTHCGMLFQFYDVQKRSSWMKDMRFDIDIVWLRDGVVVHIESSVPHVTPEKVYHPAVTSNAVLELPSGRAQKLDLRVGDLVAF